MAYNYPYGNSQQLNLDWLLREWRAFQRQIEDMIAPQYDNSATYTAYSLVIYNHALYGNPNAINVPEEFDPDHWEQIDLATILTNP